MNNYRTGDEVLFEIPATVIENLGGGHVRVRFGEIQFDADQGSLIMMKRSFHVGDEVVHAGKNGVIGQKLEDTVYLVRFEEGVGAGAWSIAGSADLLHAEVESSPKTVTAAAPVAESLVPASLPEIHEPASKGDADRHDDEPLELTQEVAPAVSPTLDIDIDIDIEIDEPTAPERAITERPGVSDMASALSGAMINRAARRHGLDLERLGTTETVGPVQTYEAAASDDAGQPRQEG